MTGTVHEFDAREGGAFSMSLSYPDDDVHAQGKTSDKTNTFRGRFVTLVPDERVVWATVFDSSDPSFAGEMTISTTLAPHGNATEVTMTCANIPPGIKPADNEEGTRQSLDKLAAYVSPSP